MLASAANRGADTEKLMKNDNNAQKRASVTPAALYADVGRSGIICTYEFKNLHLFKKWNSANFFYR